ncbi:uncharacterized protein LOC120674482 [Panicum virgatum]|uniref:DUF674 family protein n=1 Tax=Panicum virgatum TaxID=38727 RepID=A0A8T0RLP2_PANVG|nr:uncharacterized protein LOC120674482 [Panicum virgatum]KAG2586927.1 hypothetical protein PVAP13_5NG083700 [Panicum virgatum]
MAPTTSDASASTLSMKLLVDTKARRVLYAEAGKDVVDFLFSLLTLPVGTVVKILSKDSMVGSVGNLYGSVEKLDETYVRSTRAKAALLSPTGGCAAGGGKLLQLPEAPAPQAPCTKLYQCHQRYSTACNTTLSRSCGTPCQHCYKYNGGKMTVPVEIVGSTTGSGDDAAATATAALAGAGFVQGIVTYTVMDDLKVAPMSTISGITLLNTFGVTDIGTLQDKTVQLGYDEGLEILRVALQSKTVLTDVFLGKKQKA